MSDDKALYKWLLLLIIIHVSGFCFSHITISQGSVETHWRCGGYFDIALLKKLLLSLLLKEF